MWLLVQLQLTVITISESMWRTAATSFSFPEPGAPCSIPSSGGSILDTASDQGGHVLPKCRLSFGIAVASSKIAPDILPLPGESPRISFAVDARDVLIFIFCRPRCVERRSRLTASLAWAFKVNYSLVQEGIDGVRQPFGQREGSNSWALLEALNWNGQRSSSGKV